MSTRDDWIEQAMRLASALENAAHETGAANASGLFSSEFVSGKLDARYAARQALRRHLKAVPAAASSPAPEQQGSGIDGVEGLTR